MRAIRSFSYLQRGLGSRALRRSMVAGKDSERLREQVCVCRARGLMEEDLVVWLDRNGIDR